MAKAEKKEILVYAHWQGLTDPARIGTLAISQGKSKGVFSFEHAADWLKSGFTQMLDPDLQFYSGAYYQKDKKVNFGIFMDSCPDRWVGF